MKHAFLNNKGGSGKTTATVLLGAVIAEVGKRVSLTDLDPQRTAASWVPLLGLERFQESDGQADVDLVDCPPSFNVPEILEVLAGVDSIVLVTQPSPLDLWSAQKTAEFVRARLPGKRVRLLFNGVKPGTNMAKLIDAMVEKIGLERLQNVLQERQCYVNAAAGGLGALTRDARDELGRLALEIIL